MQAILRFLDRVVQGLLRLLGWAAGLALLAVIVFVAGWLFLTPRAQTPTLPEPYEGESYVTPQPSAEPPPAARLSGDCGDSRYAAAARANADSARSLIWSPFNGEEIGWETYAPLIANEIATACGYGDPGFAAALARWQRRNGPVADGVMSPAVFEAMRMRWHRRRPFSRIRPEDCPPPSLNLAYAAPSEVYGRDMQLRPGALAAYRRMIAAAHAEAPAVFSQPNALKIFSAYRDPEADAARCLTDGNCDGIRRTLCSAHRTGLALDIHVGMAPGGDPASTANFNRLAQSRTLAYRWMVRNAGRFGFVNYAYEPWHWEWTGEPI
ncbi:MAG: peptidase M15 [Caulobacteraceae bacterium]|nr:MAG: peptidase M15 [Caulobacteraceae bacterium]